MNKAVDKHKADIHKADKHQADKHKADNKTGKRRGRSLPAACPVLRQEIRQNRLSLIIWSLAIGSMISITLFMYPEMKSQMKNVSAMFSAMGKFTEAFGMNRLDFGTLIGYYGIEAGNVVGIGGALFAAITAAGALMREERDGTAEFLLAHPVSRVRIITEKLLAVGCCILVLNCFLFICSVGTIAAIGETIPWKDALLLHMAYLLAHLEIGGICFGISAFVTRSGMGIGVGLAALFYFLNIIANISKGAKWLKYLTPFGFAEASDIISEQRIDPGYLAAGMLLMAVGIALAYAKYTRKDLR